MGFSINIEDSLVRRNFYGAASFIRDIKKCVAPGDRTSQEQAVQLVDVSYRESREAIIRQKYYEGRIANRVWKLDVPEFTEEDRLKIESWKESATMHYWRYWRLIQTAYNHDLPDGPWSREYVAELKREKWLAEKANLPDRSLLPWRVMKCIEKGGCCGRKCGCCTRPRAATAFEGDVYAHCTSMCDCCFRTGGFRVEAHKTKNACTLDHPNWESASEADESDKDVTSKPDACRHSMNSALTTRPDFGYANHPFDLLDHFTIQEVRIFGVAAVSVFLAGVLYYLEAYFSKPVLPMPT
jgi:hypothetical protein